MPQEDDHNFTRWWKTLSAHQVVELEGASAVDVARQAWKASLQAFLPVLDTVARIENGLGERKAINDAIAKQLEWTHILPAKTLDTYSVGMNPELVALGNPAVGCVDRIPDFVGRLEIVGKLHEALQLFGVLYNTPPLVTDEKEWKELCAEAVAKMIVALEAWNQTINRSK